nr:hypothetical protein [uncultured Campylobacter sp.]
MPRAILSANLARNKFIRQNAATVLSPFFFANLIATAALLILDGKYLAISALKDGKENAYFKYSRICADTPTAYAKRPRHASQGKHYLDALLKNSQGKLCRFTHFSVKFSNKFAVESGWL